MRGVGWKSIRFSHMREYLNNIPLRNIPVKQLGSGRIIFLTRIAIFTTYTALLCNHVMAPMAPNNAVSFCVDHSQLSGEVFLNNRSNKICCL
ncbi:hypothetical protein ASPWEDRAFT_672729 [Aspergillus wentii DTO 134E9]|uniref:Uncharacterized protein n=1 Tax=Aspergillus wentii DTO 134E9 TaxID=1073089 RepID=A0A1L9R7G1_ASPWE|nr:uncharacterized protein ASPWEDRAFT_672729 [Aspergillus wentii DTO 134E9]OJJ30834.1 hypothetical protein ASPWEDRAFT_672729 [Aspergillus wentii DTO 134E9]